MHNDLYQKIVRVLTDYEHPEDAEITKEEAAEQVYDTLVEVQNAIDKCELRFSKKS